jgi:hypothetical protein
LFVRDVRGIRSVRELMQADKGCNAYTAFYAF